MASGKKRTSGRACCQRCSTIASLRLCRKTRTASPSNLKSTRRTSLSLRSKQPTSWARYLSLHLSEAQSLAEVKATSKPLKICKSKRGGKVLARRRLRPWGSRSSSLRTSSSARSAHSSSTSSISIIHCASRRKSSCSSASAMNLTSRGRISCCQSWSLLRTRWTSS